MNAKTIHQSMLKCVVVVVVAVNAFISSGCSTEKSNSAEIINKSPGYNGIGSLPGIGGGKNMLLKKIEEMRKIRGENYKPRTKHILSDGWAKYTNRLFLETSPYLLQHAHNPVNWYPWGDEAFETAKKLNRPVLLSVGYSTCHWCHVMEEESFEDEEIARYLNKNYIAIKVDREERPDIDAIYMSAVQALTGRGGWPMTVWLTPDRKPFYGGTYFPARDGDRGAGIGFLTLLKKVNEGYHTKQDIVVESSQQLTNAIQKMLSSETGDQLPVEDVLHKAINYYRDRFDPVYGGIKGNPKFPSSFPVRMLFRYYRRTGDNEILKIAKLTLDNMAAGGIYDHVGGGFHRYSTDEQWLVPHFEKMLYDNALLIMSYLEGYQITGDENLRQIAIDILRYVKRDMTSPDGAFYSATDADSLNQEDHLEEGYFFTWTPEELEEVLSKDQDRIVKEYYSVGFTPDFEGRHILNMIESTNDFSDRLKMSGEKLAGIIDESKEILYQARSHRPPLLRDEKVLTAWNGLMISAHARAGLILGESKYIDRAVKAAQFVLKNLYIKNRLFRSYKDNTARHNAYLDDYAFLIASLLDLYEATYDTTWLEKAMALDGVLEKYYEDKRIGGFFMTSNDHEDLIAREKPAYDGALPSGNSIAVLNLLRLGEFTNIDSYKKRAEKALMSFLGTLNSNPVALSEMLLAVDFFLDSPKEIIVVTPEGEKGKADPFLFEFRKQFLPNRILAVISEGKDLQYHAKVIPLVKGKIAQDKKVTAYVCEEGTCKLPTSDPNVFASQIKSVKKLKTVLLR